MAAGFGPWGISTPTRGDDGYDTFFGMCFLIIAVGNAARAVVVTRRPAV